MVVVHVLVFFQLVNDRDHMIPPPTPHPTHTHREVVHGRGPPGRDFQGSWAQFASGRKRGRGEGDEEERETVGKDIMIIYYFYLSYKLFCQMIHQNRACVGLY